jgi:hypothetical protein
MIEVTPKPIPKQVVVIFGCLGTGIKTVHGPFDNRTIAHEWANKNGGGQQYVLKEIEKV